MYLPRIMATIGLFSNVSRFMIIEKPPDFIFSHFCASYRPCSTSHSAQLSFACCRSLAYLRYTLHLLHHLARRMGRNVNINMSPGVHEQPGRQRTRCRHIGWKRAVPTKRPGDRSDSLPQGPPKKKCRFWRPCRTTSVPAKDAVDVLSALSVRGGSLTARSAAGGTLDGLLLTRSSRSMIG
jgi:hypothetical protein